MLTSAKNTPNHLNMNCLKCLGFPNGQINKTCSLLVPNLQLKKSKLIKCNTTLQAKEYLRSKSQGCVDLTQADQNQLHVQLEESQQVRT